ncbi:hypothetical protein VPH35_071002 [Triticum aestivum]|uniref:uncharacterized protein n=1 Tax=Triticum aestivum TaxID=4565 RepID=UPI001D01F191|nr:uncharacterized protein LOC123094190 [Triticum aestivum]
MAGKLTPPDYGYPDDGGERPPFVLIDPKAYFADRRNCTTAVCEMEGLNLKGQLQVTFCAVAPPLVSYFCVHATHMDHTEFAVSPYIMATENDGGLVLLCVVPGAHSCMAQLPGFRQYFVYDAFTRKIHHLPHPGSQHVFNPLSLTIMRRCNKGPKGKGTRTRTGNHSNLTLHPQHLTLRPHVHEEPGHHYCGSCSFVVAAQAHIFLGVPSPQLCIYQSDTGTWTKKPVVLGSCPEDHFTSKKLTIGGPEGTVAWVDLWDDIILCDVLAKRPKLTYLKLPPPIMPGPHVGYGEPRAVRDVALVDNSIKYVEMFVHPDSSSSDSQHHRWEVAAWSLGNTTHPSPKDWRLVYKLDSAHIKVDGCGATAAHPTLSTLHVGLPTLSLQNDPIVYFLAKIDYTTMRHTAWVLAVDMETKTVKNVAEFPAKRTFGLTRGYVATRISAYLQPAPGTKRMGVPMLKCPRKKHMKDVEDPEDAADAW